MKRKWTIRLTVLALAAALTASCSTKPPEKLTADETVTIKFHHWYDERIENFDRVLAAFNEAYPHIRVESVPLVTSSANESMKLIDLAAASNEAMDVIIVNAPSNYAQRVGQGLLEPLDAYLAADGIVFDDEFSLNTAVDGHIYAFPGKLNVSFIMLNKKHLEDAGLPVPKDWTWDDYMNYARALTSGAGDSKRYGTYFHTWIDYVKLALMNQMENSNLVKDDGITSNMDNPLVRRSLEIRQRGMEEGSATPHEETVVQKLGYRDQLFGERVSMLMTGSWMITEAGGLGLAQPGSVYAFAPYPKASAEDEATTPIGADFIGVYAKSANKEAAYTFAKWFATEGVVVQAKYLSSWKKADTQAIIEELIASVPSPEYIDKESLVYTLGAMEQQRLYVPVVYQAELEKAYLTETEPFLLGERDLDETLEAVLQAVQNVIDANQ